MGDNHSEILVVGEDPARLLDVATYITQKPFTSPITWWAIDNKYYTANVPIRTAGFNEVGQDGTNPCDAIVAVFDGASKGNFNVLQRWWSECEPEAEVRIVIVLQRGPEPAQSCGPVDDGPGEDAKWMAWATHQLVELVQVDSSQLDQCVDRIKNNRHQEMSRPAFGEGLMGMDRVIEALQTHTWPNLVMKAKSHVNVDLVEVDEEVAEDLDDLDDLDIMFQAIQGQ